MSPYVFIKKSWRLLDNLLTAPLAVIAPFLALLGMEFASHSDRTYAVIAVACAIGSSLLAWVIWLKNNEP